MAWRMTMVLAAVLAVGGCAATGERVSSGAASSGFDHFCGAAGEGCHGAARARCEGGQAEIVETAPVKMRRDLRVTCGPA
jgi:hypothetical protein